ncbi:hypothetical protein HPB52_017010 [Rhipicephalus sanguineus]|uniref:Uncharacterized protein n=1 Tax=Rhipicephalus sanguineus TaxID=34632 RepID=A0A9D4QH10_RHISA|nr:hypothetical protein HPB52_017010 [Rhipicephalus sanguineus]
MADGGTAEPDTTDREVKKLYRKGLRKDDAARMQTRLQKVGPDCLEPGATLHYEEMSEKDATILRRMLSTGPPVRKLCTGKMSPAAFRTAFDELEVSSELETVYFTVDCKSEDLGINLSAAFGRLWSLELRCDNVGSGFAKELARYIQENESLAEMVIWNSCGGDKGAATIITALRKNRTLKKFTLAEMELSPEMLIAFAEMLATNSTLKRLDIRSACPVKRDEVLWLLQRNRYAGVFKRLDIVWPEQLFSELAVLVRSQACCSELAVSVASIVDDEALRKFSDAVATDTKLRDLYVYPGKAILEEYDNTDDATGDIDDELEITVDECENADSENEGREDKSADTKHEPDDTVEEHEDAVDERENRDGAIEDTVDSLADGVAPGKRKRRVRGIQSKKRVIYDKERQLVSILDAVMKNRSIRKFHMLTELVTAEVATSLSELFAVNQTLTHIHVCSLRVIFYKDVETILRGLRKIYTLTPRGVYAETIESRIQLETYTLLDKNSPRVNKAAKLVIAGDEVIDQEGLDPAIRKALGTVRSSARLVKKVHELTRRPRRF